MLKIKTFIILIMIYIIAFISIKSDIDLFYPYYFFKDIIYFPVLATSKDMKLSDDLMDGINKELLSELETLKNLNNLNSTLGEFSSVTAMVIERNRMYWFNTITINKGKKDGIKEDMAVISENGLIGKVETVGSNTSLIKLITTNDINNKISVVINNNETKVYGILSGYNSEDQTLEVTSTNKQIEVSKDSLVYTSGMGGIFPSGILIGKVEGTKSDKYDVSKIIKVKTVSDFNDITFVKVLIRK